MPHLLRLSFKHGPPEDGAPFPFSVPQIRTLPALDLNVPVAFFVGENGSGKSTLLEGVAAAAELPAMGGTRDVALDPTLEHARRLGAALRLVWSRRSRQGFDRSPIAEVKYGQLEHVIVTRDFLNDPSKFTRA